MLLRLGGNSFLEIKGEDEKVKTLFSTKFRRTESSVDPNFIIECKKNIYLKRKRRLNEITVKPFCITDGHELAYIKAGKKLIIPFQSIGGDSPPKIMYERGFPSDWLRFIFDQIFGTHILTKGFSLFHAGCIAKDVGAILLPSWRFAGKTSITLFLLLRANERVEFIGDDLSLVSQKGTAQVYSDALHLDYTHLRQFSEIKNPFSALMKVRLYVKEALTSILLPESRVMEYLSQGITHFLCPGSKTYAKISLAIPNVRISKEPKPIKRVFLLLMGDDIENVSSKEIDTNDLVERMIRAMLYEREEFMRLYHAYVYATGTQNSFVEKSQLIETQILKKALKNAECLELEVPVTAQERLKETLREIASIVMLGES